MSAFVVWLHQQIKQQLKCKLKQMKYVLILTQQLMLFIHVALPNINGVRSTLTKYIEYILNCCACMFLL